MSLKGKKAKFESAIRAVRDFRGQYPRRDDVYVARRVSATELLVRTESDSQCAKPQLKKAMTAPTSTPRGLMRDH
jgi:hypothetical protein